EHVTERVVARLEIDVHVRDGKAGEGVREDDHAVADLHVGGDGEGVLRVILHDGDVIDPIAARDGEGAVDEADGGGTPPIFPPFQGGTPTVAAAVTATARGKAGGHGLLSSSG